MYMRKQTWNENILALVLLLTCLSAAFFFVSKYVADVAVEDRFETLRQSTRQLGREIRKDVETEQRLLEATAQLIASSSATDSAQNGRLLTAFRQDSLFSRLELLFPDGRVLQDSGTFADRSEPVPFVEIAAKGVHISAREAQPGGGKPVLRSYVPVVKNGVTEALLCGVIDLETLLDQYAARDSLGQAQVFVIEGKSGNFLLNTWHKGLGNNNVLRLRELKAGYSAERAIDDMSEGRAGQIAFRSKTTGTYFYAAYEPIGVCDWTVMVSMPEHVVFAYAARIRKVPYMLAVAEAALLIAYFVWLLYRERKKVWEKAGELDRVQYMLRVERILFDAPRNPGLIVEALGEVAVALAASCTFLFVHKGSAENQQFVWNGEARAGAEQWQEALRQGCFSQWSRQLEAGESVSCNEEEGCEVLMQLGIRRLLLTPVRAMDGTLIGALGAVNMKQSWERAELLESVVLSFAIALGNVEAYRTIEKIGSMDRLTGLLNCNSFQGAMELHERDGDDSLACVYVDADGLHEVNNRCGHVFGDRLLQTVAKAMRTTFGAGDTYRIGGDEFVAFCHGSDEVQVRQNVQQMAAAIAVEGYHVSVGLAMRRDVPLVCEMVKQAEQRMYEAKRSFYQERGERQLVREMNWRLEEMLAEKRDLDVFRAVIASKYKGVYIVDLRLDSMRCIYIPQHFERTAETAGGKFSAALRLYMQEYVCPTDWPAFEALLAYEYVDRLLDQGVEPEVCYRRTDGWSLLLRIYRSPEYSAQKRECIWSFENLTEDDRADILA